MPTILIVIALALGVSGGTSLIATQAKPGDILFPVKVNINEEARGLLTFSSNAKAEWEVGRAERRLAEFEELAADNELSADARAQVEANFKAHAERVQERIDALMEKGDVAGAANISARLATSLDAHARILEKLAASDATARADITAVLALVHDEHAKADAADEDAEKSISIRADVIGEAAAEGKEGAAGNKIDETQTLLAEMRGKLTADVIASAETRLETAEAAFLQGKAQLESKTYSAAFLSFQEAQRVAQESKLLLEARKNLNLDVSLSGSAATTVHDDEENAGEDKENKLNVQGAMQGASKLKLGQ